MMGSMMGHGFGGGGMIAFGLIMVLGFVLLVVSGGWAMITWMRPTRPRSSSSPADAGSSTTGRSHAREILEERYVRGELTTDDYLERIHVLGR